MRWPYFQPAVERWITRTAIAGALGGVLALGYVIVDQQKEIATLRSVFGDCLRYSQRSDRAAQTLNYRKETP